MRHGIFQRGCGGCDIANAGYHSCMWRVYLHRYRRSGGMVIDRGGMIGVRGCWDLVHEASLGWECCGGAKGGEWSAVSRLALNSRLISITSALYGDA